MILTCTILIHPSSLGSAGREWWVEVDGSVAGGRIVRDGSVASGRRMASGSGTSTWLGVEGVKDKEDSLW